MKGYLQALIDRYHKLCTTATGEKYVIYCNVLFDLQSMQEYIEKQQESHTDEGKDIGSMNALPHVAVAFKGTSKGLTEYLKKLREEG